MQLPFGFEYLQNFRFAYGFWGFTAIQIFYKYTYFNAVSFLKIIYIFLFNPFQLFNLKIICLYFFFLLFIGILLEQQDLKHSICPPAANDWLNKLHNEDSETAKRTTDSSTYYCREIARVGFSMNKARWVSSIGKCLPVYLRMMKVRNSQMEKMHKARYFGRGTKLPYPLGEPCISMCSPTLKLSLLVFLMLIIYSTNFLSTQYLIVSHYYYFFIDIKLTL